MGDVQLVPFNTCGFQVFPKVDEIDQIITYCGADNNKAIDEQIALVFDKDKKTDGTEGSDNKASNGNEKKVFDTLIEPLCTNTRKNNRQAKDIKQGGLLMNARHIGAQQPDCDIAQKAEQDTENKYLYSRTVTKL